MAEIKFDDELVHEYLAESREHLADIEKDLLAVEQNGADIDEQVVNRVFRAAHSIKGGAGFFDLTKIRELAHKTENVLDLIRSGQIVPNPEIVSILLLSFDKLRELIENHRESNHADIADFVASLTALAAEHLPDSQKASLSQCVAVAGTSPGRLIETSAFDLDRARKGGKFIYLVEYDLFYDLQRVGKTPIEVLNKLIKCGNVLETVLDLDSAGTLEDEATGRLVLEILYATVLEPDLIEELLGVSPDRIHVIEKNGTSRRLQAPAAAAVSLPLAPAPRPLAASVTAVPAAPETATIRLNVSLLDSLMSLAGELVLGRNQLNEALLRRDERGTRSGAQRVSMVTSELQEIVTLTRMQPVGGLFSKFPRLVRDLARSLGKEVNLLIEGNEVEIDKTILEGLSDPLTHMVRNAVDHGVENPEKRSKAGKPVCGTVSLKAYHQAGQVVIEIVDDGGGLDCEKVAASTLAKGLIEREQLLAMTDREKMALIFLPGVSTAEKVSDISGRGVGMDVVKTNLDKLGGKVEIDSHVGKGTSFKIKLPLTLAIIPSLLISNGGQRFAIPQANVRELIRIPESDIPHRIDVVGHAKLLLLRDRLVPLSDLSDVLGQPAAARGARPLNIALLDTGGFEYGMVVTELHDTAEIVVKPLGRHFQSLREYAGATILGDGCVAVILDVSGIAERSGLSCKRSDTALAEVSKSVETGETHSLLLFHNGASEPCAVPIGLVARIERVKHSQIESLGGRRTMKYRDATLPLVTLHDVAAIGELTEDQDWMVIVFEIGGRPLGLLAAGPLDMIDVELNIDNTTLKQPGIAGSAIFSGRTTLIVNMFELVQTARPELLADMPQAGMGLSSSEPPLILVAEDSEFFRGQIRHLMEATGYRVLVAEDGQAAWDLLQEHAAEVAVVTTDMEMPRLDGLGLARQIRGDARFHKLPIIALSSLAGPEEIARGMEAGVNEYQVKLNPEELMEAVGRFTRSGAVLAEAR